MRRPAGQLARPAEGQLDQRLSPGGGAEQRAEDQIGEDGVHDDVHEPAQNAAGVVHQNVMYARPPVAQEARLAGEFGHQIFVDVVRTVEIPDEDGADGVERDQKRDDDQRQAPDLDVVSEENQDRHTHDQDQPAAGGADTLRVLDGRWRRQAIQFRRLGRVRKASGDQPVTLAGELVDQADGLNLDDIGQGDAEGGDDERHIHEQPEPSPQCRPVLPGLVH